jgi:hypothetical protein
MVHYGGRCDGFVKEHQIKAQRYRESSEELRFCLTMEHVAIPGTLTETMLVDFWARCVPIYWGPNEEILDIFHVF